MKENKISITDKNLTIANKVAIKDNKAKTKDNKVNIKNPDLDVIEKSLIEKFGENDYVAARQRAKFKLDLARAVKDRRIELHMDQKELAKKLHTTQQQLSKYEVGENSPTADRLYDICQMLDLEIIIRKKEKINEEGIVLLK